MKAEQDSEGTNTTFKGEPFALEEFRGLWLYFARTLEEREITLRYYFQTVTAPAVIVSTAAFFKTKTTAKTTTYANSEVTHVTETTQPLIDVPDHGLGMILTVIFFVGVMSLLKYHLELENGRHIIERLNRFRRAAVARFPELGPVIAVGTARLPWPLGIGQYGSAIIALINSAIQTGAFVLFKKDAGGMTELQIGATFVALLLAQAVLAIQLAGWRRCFMNAELGSSKATDRG